MATTIALPLNQETAFGLHAGDELELDGWVLTGRDQACARLYNLLEEGAELPVVIRDQLIYFVGPSPARPGEVIGSAGPTTSGRMNRFMPRLLGAGVRGFIGKGYLAPDVKEALVAEGGVYLGAIGGSGALLSQCIVEAKVVAFEELLSEAIHAMRFQNFPVVVLNDAHGGDLYAEATKGAR
jgi:fumarate hydratase subunit beta